MAKPAAIQPVSDVTDWIRLMVVAGSGWGKTPFAGTADQRGTGGMKALFLSCDPEGVTSAFTSGSTADVWQVKTWETLEEAYRYLNTGGGCDEYQVVIIDSLNELQNVNKEAVLRSPTRGKSDPDVLAQPDYQKNQIYMVRMVKQINDLPIHVIWNIQWKKEDDETDLGFRYEPLLQGQRGELAEQIKGYMKIIAYGTRVQKKKAGTEEIIDVPRLVFQQQPPFMARDRTGALGPYMDNPTFPKIAAAVKEKMAEARKVAAAGGPAAQRATARPAKKAVPARRPAARKP